MIGHSHAQYGHFVLVSGIPGIAYKRELNIEMLHHASC